MNGTSSFDLGRCQEADGRDPPGRGGGHPALELLHPLRRPGDLDAARLEEDPQLLVLVDAVDREGRHLLGVVGQEDEVRGVAGRAAGAGQRALLEQDDVRPALLGQVVGHAAADDAGADDDDVGPIRKTAHSKPNPRAAQARLTMTVFSSVRRSMENLPPTRPRPLCDPLRPPKGRCGSQ